MPQDCFFCGLVVSEEFEPAGDACALCHMMHDITKREPDELEMVAPNNDQAVLLSASGLTLGRYAII